MIYKLYRKAFDIKSKVDSKFRILHLKLKYPSLIIKGNTFIGKNCDIVCVDGGKMILNNAHINYGTYLHCEKNAALIIDSSYIGMNSVIVSLTNIHIKPNCEIAEMVVIRDQNHRHDLSTTPISQQGHETDLIIINENVWIGAKSTILKGVVIGENSIIGAHSLVNKSFPSNSKLIGIPAKKIN